MCARISFPAGLSRGGRTQQSSPAVTWLCRTPRRGRRAGLPTQKT